MALVQVSQIIKQKHGQVEKRFERIAFIYRCSFDDEAKNLFKTVLLETDSCALGALREGSLE